jgi:diguanylate cyclase (GGDEF)-like protein
LFQFRNILHFVFPGGILFVSCCALLYTDAWTRIESSQIDIIGIIILVFGVFLGWRFDRNRLLYALALLLIADIADRWFVNQSSFITLHHIVAVLVPFNFCLIGLMKEKGVRKLYSLLQLALLPGQMVLIYLWLTRWDSLYLDFLDTSHLPTPLNTIPDVFLAFFVLALTLQFLRYLRFQTPIETAFIWAIVCASTAGVMTPGVEPTLFRIFAALIIIISVFEMSYALAYVDELTLLPSRRAQNEALRKVGSQYVIAMADIDFFKKLNDTYGHDVGDQVLKMVAARLAKCTGGARVFRYGGEEFCLLFNGKKTETAMEPLEKLRQSIADEPFIIRQKLRPVKKPKTNAPKTKTRKSIKVTISIGVAEKNSQLKTTEDVMKAADLALYRAKKGGRNRVAK